MSDLQFCCNCKYGEKTELRKVCKCKRFEKLKAYDESCTHWEMVEKDEQSKV